MDLRALTLFVGLCSSASPAEVRLVGGPSPCSGRLEQQRQSDWEPVRDQNLDWNLTAADQVCRRISCGSVVSLRRTLDQEPPQDLVTREESRAEGTPERPPFRVEITCSDSVRLENGTDRCSGRLQVKRNQVWSSVCSDGFDLQDAEVVCRELGCGSPSGFKEELYGEAPEWIPEFRCGGHESALLHCERSDRDTCSPGTTVTLTCSDPGWYRLVEGSGRCDGTLEGREWDEWRPVDYPYWNLRLARMVCRDLDCGSPLSTRRRETGSKRTWGFEPLSTASSHYKHQTSSGVIEITCSDFVRLEDRTHRCSGRLQVKRNQVWSSVCSDGFDLQDAEVVCRELGCGSPSGFKEELYGEATEWIPEFRCGGHESALLHCERSDRDTCSPGTTVTLTCSAPDQVRLVGNRSTCAGELQMKVHEDWRPVVDIDWYWNQNWTSAASSVCSQLGCGSIVTTDLEEIGSKRPMWIIQSSCFQSTLSLQDCLVLSDEARDSDSLQVICSDLLVQPNISVSSSRLEVQQQKVRVLLGSNFSIICSTRPQYPGGSFQLVFNSSSSTLNYVLPAVTHSAVFLFPAAEGLHRGTYTCIYHLYVFSHNFSSTSRPIYLIPSAPLMDLIIRLVVHLLVMVLLISVTCFYSRKYSVETRSRNEETNVVAELQ
ncbi:scavenger receptor cysteine-rich type 1 protein M130-like isoform X4 [Acanthochromis polyacanthus]|uniref:scavenger receptor cysteine-rich type 1 protein M130-like isoform X4 n=1 Tax=Acanthochromis polyacanthus TaxID=80966 RepID=UPI002234AF0A|nr:scavenger receptor cysteine-rich type 1 protein M130-like isoform X4 [Acanthochromis polyacanthus]